MKIRSRLLVIHCDEETQTYPGLFPLGKPVELFYQAVSNGILIEAGRTVLLHRPPWIFFGSGPPAITEAARLVEAADEVTLAMPLSVWPEFDSRLLRLGGVQSNLPAQWSFLDIRTPVGSLQFDLAVVARADIVGYERVLIFGRGAEGDLLVSFHSGEWSRPIQGFLVGFQVHTRLFLKEISYDGQTINLWHGSVCESPDPKKVSALEKRILEAAGPYLIPSSENRDFQAEECRLENSWTYHAILELLGEKDLQFVIARARCLEKIEGLPARLPPGWVLVLANSKQAWSTVPPEQWL